MQLQINKSKGLLFMKMKSLLVALSLNVAIVLSSSTTFAATESEAKEECEKAMQVYSKEFAAQREANGEKPVAMDMSKECTSNVKSFNFWRCVSESQRKGNSTNYAIDYCKQNAQ